MSILKYTQVGSIVVPAIKKIPYYGQRGRVVMSIRWGESIDVLVEFKDCSRIWYRADQIRPQNVTERRKGTLRPSPYFRYAGETKKKRGKTTIQ